MGKHVEVASLMFWVESLVVLDAWAIKEVGKAFANKVP